MACSLETQLPHAVERYIAGQDSLEDFRDRWLELTSGLSYRDGTSLDLAGEVELAYAEASNGDLSQDQLRARLSEALAADPAR